MKIVLVRPNYQSHIITPPLGLGYLSSYAKSKGQDVRIIDGLKENLDARTLLERILTQKPDAVGITCLTAFYKEVVTLSHLLKQHNIPVVLGGPHPTILPQQTLTDSQADYVIRGEGEIALSRLAAGGFVNDGIPGVCSQKDVAAQGAAEDKAERPANLDELPFPDWEQMDPNTYPPAPHGAIVRNYPVGVITTTRGCPYECTFCASPQIYDRTIRFRSPENVVDEVQYLVGRFGVREVHFEDDNLTLKRRHVERICNLLIERKVRISWACPNGIRADRVDEDLIRLMKTSGCYCLAFGIESANPEILKNIRKGETLETIEHSIEIASKYGISCQGFFIFGLPGETPETIEETIRFAVRSKLSRAQFLILDVIPGSHMWADLQGQFVPNWSKNSYKEPEWIPPGLSADYLMKAQSRAFRRFYAKPGRFFHLARSVRFRQLRYLLRRFKEYRII